MRATVGAFEARTSRPATIQSLRMPSPSPSATGAATGLLVAGVGGLAAGPVGGTTRGTLVAGAGNGDFVLLARTVKVRAAGVGSMLPAGSIARMRTVYVSMRRPANVIGVAH